jgi:hypothetical protein
VTTGVDDRPSSKTQEACAYRAILAARLADTTTRIAILVGKRAHELRSLFESTATT